MAFFRCDVMSESLGMATSVLVTMPDTGDLAAAPVVYLLHGLTDNCTGWLRYTQAEHLARTHGAILIVPEVQRSFYTDMACGPKYFTYINQELPTLSTQSRLQPPWHRLYQRQSAQASGLRSPCCKNRRAFSLLASSGMLCSPMRPISHSSRQ